MIWWLYNLLFPVAFLFLLPKFLVRMCRRGGYARDFAQRFASYSPDVRAALSATDRPIWIQAVSVGEIAVAFTCMDEIRRRRPNVRFVLTTNTSTAHAIAKKRIAAPDVLLYFPLDFPPVVRRALRVIRPAALVLVENEIWPNLVRRAAASSIPVYLVNGRISEHSYRGYRRLRFVTRRLLPLFARFSVQTPGDRDRLVSLGAPPSIVDVCGSAKYDIGPTPPAAAARAAALLRTLRPDPSSPVVVAGSTWPGEEEILLDWLTAELPRHPDLLLVLVPRHAERRREVLDAIAARSLPFVQRSQFPDGSPPPPVPPAVLLVDTTGELRSFYANANAVFVGKSLTQTGGQNPIEPAADARPVVVGPHMENFPAVARDFDAARAWVRAPDADSVRATLTRWLDHPEEASAVAAAATSLLAASSGAAARMTAPLLSALPPA